METQILSPNVYASDCPTRQVLDIIGPTARLGLVVCGGNVTEADLLRWEHGD